MLQIIIGAPRSGIKLISQCLNILGSTPLKDNNLPDTNTVNQLLLQDLGASPYTPALPKDWLESEAAANAQERINKLLTSTKPLTDNDSQLTFIEDKLLSCTFPLWRKALESAHVDYQCLHIIRHPWEVAMSLNHNEGLDLQTAHIAWLAYVREALQHCPEQTIITFDQFLADPVSTCNSFIAPLPDNKQLITNNLPALLDHVQPSLKNHHAGNFTEKETYKPYADIYNQLRLEQYSSSAQISDNQPAPPAGLNQAQPDCEAKFNLVNRFKETSPQSIQPGLIRTLGSTDSDLIDSLLQALSQRITQQPSLPINKSQLTINYNESSHLTVLQSSLQLSDGTAHQFPLIEAQWQKLTIPVPDPSLLAAHGAALVPLNTVGVVAIASISLVNRATGDVLWMVKAQDLQELRLEGEAIPLPDDENLVLVAGEEARIVLPAGINVPDCPLELVVWVKAHRNLDELRRVIAPLPTRAEKELARMVQQAESAESEQDWNAAIGLWQKASQYARQHNLAPPQDAFARITSAQLQIAIKLRKQGQYDAALGVLQDILQEQPRHVQVLQELGVVQSARKQWDEAADVYDRLLQTQSVAIQAIMARARSRLNADRLDQAITELEQAKNLGFDTTGLLHQLAVAYRDDQQWDAAEQLVHEVIRSDPAYAKKKMNFATFAADVLRKRKQVKKAYKLLQTAVDLANARSQEIPLNTQAILLELKRAVEQPVASPEVSKYFYDNIYAHSEKYQANPEDSAYMPVWEKVRDALKSRGVRSVLDIGCGPGQFAQYLIGQIPNLKYQGVDYSHIAIREAKRRCPSAEFFERDVMQDNALDEFVADAFVVLEVLEHIEHDCELILKVPSGQWVVLSVPNLDSIGHVRFFKDQDEVQARYGGLFADFNVQTVALSGRSKIFLISGFRSSCISVMNYKN